MKAKNARHYQEMREGDSILFSAEGLKSLEEVEAPRAEKVSVLVQRRPGSPLIKTEPSITKRRCCGLCFSS